MRIVLNIWTPKGWWRLWYKLSSPRATRTIPAAVEFILLEGVVRRRESAALLREPPCTRLRAAFKASCCCARSVSLASSMRKLRNGSSLEAFELRGVRFVAAPKVVDRAATVSHAIRRFRWVIHARSLLRPVSVGVDP